MRCSTSIATFLSSTMKVNGYTHNTYHIRICKLVSSNVMILVAPNKDKLYEISMRLFNVIDSLLLRDEDYVLKLSGMNMRKVAFTMT